MPLQNDLDESRLRSLAELRDSGQSVLSIYLDLDPAEFAAPPAREAQVDSLLDEASREIEATERPHGELLALREALERARQLLHDFQKSASGARAIAIFLSGPLELEEVLRLDTAGERCPVDGEPLQPRGQIVEDAVHAAITQSAQALALRERPELGSLGGIAATLRF
jgi:DNA repair exonuclease SbcCD ATPase subunit